MRWLRPVDQLSCSLLRSLERAVLNTTAHARSPAGRRSSDSEGMSSNSDQQKQQLVQYNPNVQFGNSELPNNWLQQVSGQG